jgi:hypothetical protein
VTRFRSLCRSPLVGPILALTLLWVGVAVPLVDRELAEHSTEAVSNGADASPLFSHDHRLCLLLQSSPGWIAPEPASLEERQISRDDTLQAFIPWTSARPTRGPSARAPPYLS